MRLHHVQLACPPGGEDAARRFWVDGLGLVEAAKPDTLAGRGGAWFRAHDDHGHVCLEVHVGVERGFVPAGRAHPAILLDSVEQLDELASRLEGLGFVVEHGERSSLPGYVRLHCLDAHGNRVELMSR